MRHSIRFVGDRPVSKSGPGLVEERQLGSVYGRRIPTDRPFVVFVVDASFVVATQWVEAVRDSTAGAAMGPRTSSTVDGPSVGYGFSPARFATNASAFVTLVGCPFLSGRWRRGRRGYDVGPQRVPGRWNHPGRVMIPAIPGETVIASLPTAVGDGPGSAVGPALSERTDVPVRRNGKRP
jgi:hypothetical protein